MEDIFSFMDDEGKPVDIDAIKGSMIGESIDASELALVAGYADLAVKAAVAELTAMAKHLGQSSVPLEVLAIYAEEQSVASQMLWQIAELTGAELTMPGVTVPDDLSELDGES